MNEPKRITSAQNALVKTVVKLRDRRARDQQGRFLIEGYREIRRAAESALPIETLLVSPEHFLGENEEVLISDAVTRCGAEVVELARPVFEKVSYRDRPDGLLAVAPKPEWRLGGLSLPKGRVPLVVVAVGIEKPGNLGTMLRTADAVGVDAVIVCDRCTDVFNPNVVRASVGTLFTVPVAEGSTGEVVKWLARNEIETFATTPDASQLHYEAPLIKPAAVIVGSEQLGLPDSWLAATDHRIRIPMTGSADSLNAAIATAVVLFEAVRQRSAT